MDFFLQELIDFIIEDGGIVDEKERRKANILLRGFYGFSYENMKYNYSIQLLMKVLFGMIYNITNYKNLLLKGKIFYEYYTETIDGKFYLLRLFFVKKNSIKKVFLDEKNYQFYMNKIEKLSTKLVANLKNNVTVEEIFSVEKFIKDKI